MASHVWRRGKRCCGSGHGQERITACHCTPTKITTGKNVLPSCWSCKPLFSDFITVVLSQIQLNHALARNLYRQSNGFQFNSELICTSEFFKKLRNCTSRFGECNFSLLKARINPECICNLHWCYTWTVLFSANQNQIIFFMCIFLGF